MTIYDACEEAGLTDEQRHKVLDAVDEKECEDHDRKEKNELLERVEKLEKEVAALVKKELGSKSDGKKEDGEKKESKKSDSDDALIDAVVSDVCSTRGLGCGW